MVKQLRRQPFAVYLYHSTFLWVQKGTNIGNGAAFAVLNHNYC